MTDSKEVPQWMVKADRRSNRERRQYSYTACIPERRCGKDRRIEESKGKTYLPDIKDDDTMSTEEVRLRKC